MPFHLILPGLLWPEKALRDTVHDLPLPNLSWMLGRARLRWFAPQPLEDWLCHALGCASAGHPPAAAALRLLGDGIDPGNALWMCADPVHLKIAQGAATLVATGLDITDQESLQVAQAVAPLLAEHGEFVSGTGGHGYLRLHAETDLLAPPPSAAAGRVGLMPSGTDAVRWRRISNEAQMVLHGLPLNRQREAEHRPTLNSLWFWGPGHLPAAASGATRPYRMLVGNHALLRGLAAWSGIAHRPAVPADSRLLQDGAGLLLLEDLQAPAQALDAGAWRAALAALDRDVVAPLRAALARGRLDSLSITGLGDEAGADIHLRRADALRFWHRPRALHELAYRNAAPA